MTEPVHSDAAGHRRVYRTPTCTQPSRLRDLHDVFCARVAADDPAFWAQWDAYRTAPDDACPSPIERSDLIVRMAPHLSRFVAALFRVGDAAGAHGRAARSQLEPLFRFKVDFVRKRALPLVKGGAHVHARSRQTSRWSRRWRSPWAHLDHEQAIAMAGCALLDREAAARATGTDAEKADVAAQIDALKRWCAACLHDPGYRPWVIFRFPETLDYFNLVQVQRPRAGAAGGDARPRRPPAPPRRLQADRPALDAARGAQRDPLLRAVPRARQGLVLEGAARQGRARSPRIRSAFRCPAARSTRRFPRCTWCGRPAMPSARWRSSSSTTRWCPGTGHRICNDCMKACIYQKQEPVNIPQIETGVLTDVLRMPWGVEIYGLLTRWNPLNVRRPVRAAVQRPQRAGRRSRSGRLHAGALPAQRRLRRRGDRRPEDRAAAGRS